MGEGVNEDHNEVSDCVQPGSPDIQNPVVGIVMEGVPEGISSQVLVGRNLLSQEYCHRGVATPRGDQVSHEAAKLVDYEGASVQGADVNGNKLCVLGPLSITRVMIAFTYKK